MSSIIRHEATGREVSVGTAEDVEVGIKFNLVPSPEGTIFRRKRDADAFLKYINRTEADGYKILRTRRLNAPTVGLR